MAWHRSNGNGEAASSPLQGKGGVTAMKRRGRRFPIVAGAIVILGAAVAAWWLWPEGKTRQYATSTKRGMIKEVTPAAAPKIAEEKTEKKPIPYWKRDNTNGFSECMIEKWKQMHRPPPKMTNNYFITRSPQPFEIFPTRAENEIAMLLTMEPGSILVGSPEYGEDFKREFLESCKTPIIPSASDDEYSRALKKMMNETKIELMNRIKNGEDICEIMADSRNEMQRLAVVKQDLENMARDIIEKDAQSEEDIDTAISAVNRMMEEKGLAPISLSPITKRCIMRRIGITPKGTK